MDKEYMDALRAEQRAFDAKLPELLEEHRGEFAVFKDGAVVALFPSYAEAYATALRRFGHEAPFLISEIAEQTTAPISISWNAGVLVEP
ncbi:MAG: hypothetical protein U0166_22510 [Acidobacteriota bacterium]